MNEQSQAERLSDTTDDLGRLAGHSILYFVPIALSLLPSLFFIYKIAAISSQGLSLGGSWRETLFWGVLLSLASAFCLGLLFRDQRLARLRSARRADAFLSIASHELKTPLTSLQLQTQLRQRELLRNFPGGFSRDRLDADFRSQYEYVQRIARLVDEIVDVSCISAGKLEMQPEEFDLCEMVNDVLARFQVTAESSGVQVRVESCEPVVGRWDRFRLEQVLFNLLANALSYGMKKPIHVRVSCVGSQAVFSVRDEGIGIRSEDQARIFKRFERAISENEVSGLGLGLYISREIVHAHDGKLSVRSEYGGGSEFIVSLPQV